MTHCRTTELEGTPTHLILQMGAPHTPQFPPWAGLTFPVVHSANPPLKGPRQDSAVPPTGIPLASKFGKQTWKKLSLDASI